MSLWAHFNNESHESRNGLNHPRQLQEQLLEIKVFCSLELLEEAAKSFQDMCAKSSIRRTSGIKTLERFYKC